MTERFGGDVLRKYAGIDLAGRRVLGEAQVKDYLPTPEESKRRFNTALRFEGDSEAIFRERVMGPLEQAERDFSTHLTIAVRDFPLHATVMEGRFEGAEENKKLETFTDVEKELAAELESVLMGQEIEFKYLLIDKGNLLLTASNIPEIIIAIRERLNAVYAAHDLKPLPMKNILHVTVSRMVQKPQGEPDFVVAILRAYRAQMLALRRSISKDPLRLKVGTVYTGSTQDLLVPRS